PARVGRTEDPTCGLPLRVVLIRCQVGCVEGDVLGRVRERLGIAHGRAHHIGVPAAHGSDVIGPVATTVPVGGDELFTDDQRVGQAVRHTGDRGLVPGGGASGGTVIGAV